MTRLDLNTVKIDATRRVNFTWQGQPLQGLAGDTVASALFANGVRIFGRSLKYHRPRGLYSLDGESANTLVHLNRECNVRSETTPLAEGDMVSPQNSWGPVEKDRYRFMDRMDGFMPAGFYYRRFHKPAFAWPLASRFIRKMAGTGVLDTAAGWEGRFSDLYPSADVCVIGGGPAGMAAALAAAGQGLRVILMEGRAWLGGHFDWRDRETDGQSLHDRATVLARQVAADERIRVFTRTSVLDLSGDNQVTAFRTLERGDGGSTRYHQEYIHIRPRSVVVATGTMERPLVFEQNEMPGIMQVGCAWRLARTWGILPGREAVFAVGDDLGLEAAVDLAGLGLSVRAVADARESGQDSVLVSALEQKGISLMRSCTAVAATGNGRIRSVSLSGFTSGSDRSGAQSISCDLLVASAGQTPVTGPLNTVGAKMGFDGHTGFFLPRELPPGVHAGGRVLGYVDPESIETSGRLAGLKAALGADADAAMGSAIRNLEECLADLPGPAGGNTRAFHPAIGKGRKSFVCFDEDGTVKSIRQSVDQGFDKPELVKRFGGFGLGPGQGGVPGHNLPLVMSQLAGQSRPDISPTNTRSPLAPVLMATVAGPNPVIKKYTPMVSRQQSPGTEFIRTGAWMRANRISDDVETEVAAVRKGSALLDVSTLGKFRVFGPDAFKALQRVYISDMAKVEPGKLTYSAMLNTSGALVDDGVVTRTGPDDYYLTTSSAWAGEFESWIRYHTRFDNLDFHVVSLTDALASVNLAGPKAFQVLSELTQDDMADLPYMGYREITLSGLTKARVLRVGFLGEPAYELHFPAAYGEAVWDALMAAGRQSGIRAIGLEAQNICRMEKGHVIIGLETEQSTNLLDLGLGFLWDRNDEIHDKVGAPALKFSRNQPGRTKLAGLEISGGCPGDGAIIHQGDTIVGHICTARESRTLGKILALALVKDPLQKPGTALDIFQDEGRGETRFKARVVPLPFYDPKGVKLRENPVRKGGA